MVNGIRLHYINDPLCGWCYGAAPLLAAAEQAGIPLTLHAGGMLSHPHNRTITPDWRSYVMPHDQRIAAMSGQPFGDAYFDGLLRDIGAPLDSTPPIAAMLAAERLGHSPRDMLSRLQGAHYRDGLRIAERETIMAVAGAAGLDGAAFATAYDAALAEVPAHTAATRQLMRRHGLQGFPSLLLERGGEWIALDIGRWFGEPDAFVAALLTQQDHDAAGPVCTPEGCD